MLSRLKKFFDFLVDPDASRIEMDDYLESKNITTISELEFWMKEYDNRKRIHSRLISEGKNSEAAWVMKL